MRILVYSPAFHPLIGGLEISTELLCSELVRLGCEIKLICRTPSSNAEEFPFEVVRSPSPPRFFHLTRWCEVFFQRNVSLKGLWPLIVVHRPWVVSHHSWYRRPDGSLGWRDRLKRWLLRYATNIAISKAMAEDLRTPSVVIGNPYRSDLFRRLPGLARTRELVFVGRLVSDKGLDILLTAMADLANEGMRPQLTVIGDGPEAPELEAMAARLGVRDQIDFLGTRSAAEIVRELNCHSILVVPSRYNEPFGNVALEGVACGCVVVGSRGGGLSEAIGPCGLTFPNGDVAALTHILARILRGEVSRDALLVKAPNHLEAHRIEAVARRYLGVLHAARSAEELSAGAATSAHSKR